MAEPRISPPLITRSHTVGDPRWAPGGARVAWVDAHDGRADLVVAPTDASTPPVVVTAACGIGGDWCWADPETLVVTTAEHHLAVVSADGVLQRVLARDGSVFSPAVSARGEVAFAIERDDACDIAVVPLDGSAWPARCSSADYARDPSWSADGRLLAWHEWDLPDLPWDASRIVVRDRDDAKPGTTGGVIVAGGDGVSTGQPRFSPSGPRLAFVSDAQGWPVVWTANGDGSDAAPVLAEPHEHAEPAWGSGQRSYAWSPGGTEIAWCRNEQGFGRLVVGAPGRLSARELSKGWHRGLDWAEAGIVCARSGAVTPGQIVVLAANGSGRRALARGPAGGFEATGLVEPRAVTWKAAGATVHGLLYRPSTPAALPPPLIVQIHGGPSGQALADWNPRVQRLVQRGVAVLAPNPRGSTGYGRAYAQALAREWGARDVEDVAAGVRHAVKAGWGDGGRVAVMGASAGGYLALLLAARAPDLAQAVIALYPVTDLLDLARTTHRFESGAHLRLVGPLPDTVERYRDRSPITHAAAIRAPVLLLHGTADTAVPVAQSKELVARLRAAGTRVEYHEYEGEGHGWRRSDTVTDELARVDDFLARTLLVP